MGSIGKLSTIIEPKDKVPTNSPVLQAVIHELFMVGNLGKCLVVMRATRTDFD